MDPRLLIHTPLSHCRANYLKPPRTYSPGTCQAGRSSVTVSGVNCQFLSLQSSCVIGVESLSQPALNGLQPALKWAILRDSLGMFWLVFRICFFLQNIYLPENIVKQYKCLVKQGSSQPITKWLHFMLCALLALRLRDT